MRFYCNGTLESSRFSKRASNISLSGPLCKGRNRARIFKLSSIPFVRAPPVKTTNTRRIDRLTRTTGFIVMGSAFYLYGKWTNSTTILANALLLLLDENDYREIFNFLLFQFQISIPFQLNIRFYFVVLKKNRIVY